MSGHIVVMLVPIVVGTILLAAATTTCPAPVRARRSNSRAGSPPRAEANVSADAEVYYGQDR